MNCGGDIPDWQIAATLKAKTGAAVSSYQKTPLGEVLPVEITNTPDLVMLPEQPENERHPVFLDGALGSGILAEALPAGDDHRHRHRPRRGPGPGAAST